MSAALIPMPPAEVVEATVDLTPGEARALTDRIVGVARDLVDLVQQAYTGRAWAALDYPSWEAYLEAEIGTALAGLPKPQRRGVVGVLRDSGMSPRAIAPVMGLASDNTVRADLKLVRPDGVTSPTIGRDGKTYAATQATPVEATPKPKVVRTTTVLELLEQVGPDGLTIPELMRRKKWTYGAASACLSRLHASKRIDRLDTWRASYSAYVLPMYTGERAVLSPGQRRSTR